MKQIFDIKILFFIVISMSLFSCASRNEVAYYQNADTVLGNNSTDNYETILQPDDLLRIVVLAQSIEAAAPFNIDRSKLGSTDVTAPGQETNVYLVDREGYIDFPFIGKIKLGGLTKGQAITELNSVLRSQLVNPSVNITIMNFKVTVQGEVVKPGVITVQSERLTLPEALGMAGDLTIYGKRDNIMIVREKEGKKTVERIDITKADFVNSPYYYLAQNDLVYVEPNKTRMNASKVGPNINVIISASSLLVTLIVLITR